MGFNTTVVVMNDALTAIENDPKFGKSLVQAILKLQRGKQVDVPAYSYNEDGEARGVHCNAATAIESHHADGNAIVAVGGNCATVLGMTWGLHHREEDKIDMLKQLASECGYNLRKKKN